MGKAFIVFKFTQKIYEMIPNKNTINLSNIALKGRYTSLITGMQNSN